MAALAVNPQDATYLNRTAYISISEYIAAPTAMDTTQLVVGGTADQQAQALAGVIDRASSAVDVFCRQVLAATYATQSQWCVVKTSGYISLVCTQKPVLELTSLSMGPDPSSIAAVTAPSNVSFGTGVISLQPSINGSNVFSEWTYVNGWPHTQLAVDATAGATSITVAGTPTAPTGGPLGIYPGTTLNIYSGPSAETIAVASTYTGGNVIPLVSPLVNSYSVPPSPDVISVSGLPPAVRQATISLTTAFIKNRGDAALILNDLNAPSQMQSMTKDADGSEDIALAKDLLAPFRRAV